MSKLQLMCVGLLVFLFVIGAAGQCGYTQVVDNVGTNPYAVAVGAMKTGTNGNTYYGSNWFHDNKANKGSVRAIYWFSIAQVGYYHLYASYTAGTNRATKALVDIMLLNFNGKVNRTTYYMNQQEDPTKNSPRYFNNQTTPFRYLTTVYFDFGGGRVALWNNGTAGTYVIYDAFAVAYDCSQDTTTTLTTTSTSTSTTTTTSTTTSTTTIPVCGFSSLIDNEDGYPAAIQAGDWSYINGSNFNIVGQYALNDKGLVENKKTSVYVDYFFTVGARGNYSLFMNWASVNLSDHADTVQVSVKTTTVWKDNFINQQVAPFGFKLNGIAYSFVGKFELPYLGGRVRVSPFTTLVGQQVIADSLYLLGECPDSTPPVISGCPSGYNGSTILGGTNYVYNWTVPTFSDNIALAYSPVCSRNSSDNDFQIGRQDISCYTQDNSGNYAFCNFSVIVADLEPPTLQCPPSIVQNLTFGDISTYVNWVKPIPMDNVNVTQFSCTSEPDSVYLSGVTEVTCTATDFYGNSKSCSFTIKLIDTSFPVLTCPLTTIFSSNPVVSYDVEVSDNNVGVVFSCSPPSGSTFPSGTKIVNCTAVDSDNNAAYCFFNVSIDSIPPVISCPSNKSVSTLSGENFYPNNFLVNATDNQEVQSSFCNIAANAELPVGGTLIQCNVTDRVGLSAFCEFYVTVVDSEAPVLSCIGGQTIFTDEDRDVATYAIPLPEVSDNVSPLLNLNLTCDSPLFNEYPMGTTNVSCSVVDEAGNVASCVQRITVVDAQKPTLTPGCPTGNVTVNNIPGKPYATPVWPAITATDNAGTPSFSCNHYPGENLTVGETFVECSAQDASYNSISCSFYVIVVDNEPPVLNCPTLLNLPTNLGSQLGTMVYNLNATDNLLPPAVTCSIASGTPLNVGTYSVNCTALDFVGNSDSCQFTVVVLDQEKPTLTMCPSNFFLLTDPGQPTANYTYTPPSYSDNIGVVNSSCSVTPFFKYPIGDTTVTCSAVDAAGNEGKCSFVITVADFEAPTISCPAPISTLLATNKSTIKISYTTTFADNAPNSVLSCSKGSNTYFSYGTTTVYCSAQDTSGNEADCSFTVFVDDQQNPVVKCPASQVVTIPPGDTTATISWAAAVMSDNVNISASSLTKTDSLGSVDLSSSATSTLFQRGTSVLLLTASDPARNSASCTWVISVVNANQVDTVPPKISGCPSSSPTNLVTLTKATESGVNYASITWNTISASDDVQLANAYYTSEPFGYTQGSKYVVGTTVKIVFTAFDTSQNSNSCIFFVKALDKEPPVIQNCPSKPLVFEADSSDVDFASSVSWDIAVKDNVALQSNSTNFPPGYFALGDTNVTLTAKDTSGNAASCHFTIRVKALQQSTASASSSTSPAGAIGGGVAGVLVIAFLLLLFLFLYRKHKALEELYASQRENMNEEYILKRAAEIQLAMLQQKYARPAQMAKLETEVKRNFQTPSKDLTMIASSKEIPRETLDIGREIGAGEFGEVFEGIYLKVGASDTAQVAIKSLKPGSSERDRTKFLQEAAIMAQFDHPNIVNLIGLVTKNEPYLIVLEFMHLGSLGGYLKSDFVKGKLDTGRLIKMAGDVCAGMYYLASIGFVHRDLAARNVLVSKELVCKVSDFGLSHELSDEEEGIYSGSSAGRIPIRWCALEAVIYRKFSTASDVWSYGILLWELFSYAEMPYGLWNNQKVVEEIQKGWRLPRPEPCPAEIYRVMRQCWDADVEKRPNFEEIYNVLLNEWNQCGGIVTRRMSTLSVTPTDMGHYTLASNVLPGQHLDSDVDTSDDDSDVDDDLGLGAPLSMYDNANQFGTNKPKTKSIKAQKQKPTETQPVAGNLPLYDTPEPDSGPSSNRGTDTPGDVDSHTELLGSDEDLHLTAKHSGYLDVEADD